MSMLEFQPNSEEERQFLETYSSISITLSRLIRSLNPEDRLPALKQGEPTDASLLALYLSAMKQEDYETCNAAKSLIEERGIPVTKWPNT